MRDSFFPFTIKKGVAICSPDREGKINPNKRKHII
jgi:hypothetical protein